MLRYGKPDTDSVSCRFGDIYHESTDILHCILSFEDFIILFTLSTIVIPTMQALIQSYRISSPGYAKSCSEYISSGVIIVKSDFIIIVSKESPIIFKCV